MAELGKCLLFYLKYPAEMARLYETEEPDTDGLSNPNETLGKIRRVGDAGSREGAELLEVCFEAVKPHFDALGFKRTGADPNKN